MSTKPSSSTIRLLIGVMLGASFALIALAVWMIARDEGSPVFVAVAGSLLGAFAAVLASRSKTKAD